MSLSTAGLASFKSVTINGNDASAIVQRVELFESIYSQGISAKITIADGADFYTKAKLQDNLAKVEISISDANGSPINATLRVANISDRSRIKQNLDQYTLTAFPKELIKNPKTQVDKAYESQKISDIEKKIFDDHYMKDSDNNPGIDVEETEGKANYTPTNKSALHVMHWANKRGKTASKDGQRIFYQTFKGYKIKNLQSLIDEGGSGETFEVKQANIGAEGGDPNQSVLSFYDNTNSNKAAIDSKGAAGTKTVYVDPYTGRKKTVERKNDKGEITRTEVLFWHNTDKDSQFNKRQNEEVEKSNEEGAKNTASNKKAHKLDNRVITIQVPFQAKHEVGTKCTFNLAKPSEEASKDERSGSYLITSNRVVVYRSENTVVGRNILELKSVTDADKENG